MVLNRREETLVVDNATWVFWRQNLRVLKQLFERQANCTLQSFNGTKRTAGRLNMFYMLLH